MLHEYAIEPAALTRFETCRYILEKMGIPNGRYIADYPVGWFNSVRRACDEDDGCLPLNRTKIMTLLRNTSKCILRHSYRFYDDELNWLNNAECGHAENPFHAILARENPRDHRNVLCVDDITDEHQLIRVPRERFVIRSAQELQNVALPFFKLAKDIVFVDGHFNPQQQKYRNTTCTFLQGIRDSGSQLKRLEYHTRGDRKGDSLSEFTDFKNECLSQFSSILPTNVHLRIFRWNERTGGTRFHARYLLTNIGGLRFDYGIDEAFDAGRGTTNQETEVSLIDQNVYEKLWERFSDPEQYFDKSESECVEI